MKIAIAIVVVLVSLGVAYAQDIDTIRQAIEEEGADWTAEENPISDLPDDVIDGMMGVILPPITPQVYDIGEPSTLVPQEWDWRDVGGSNWVTPVKNQGSCGSCWAFGCIVQLESATMIANAGPTPLDLSEQYMVSCNTTNLGCNGGYMDRAYNFLKEDGAPSESCFPYKALDLPCSDACSNPLLAKIDAWYSVSQTIADLQEAVYLQPITVAFYVYTDFMYYTGGIYKYVSGSLRGGHAVCVVGWSTPGKYFIVKNSWGQGWGEDGYFRIAFSEMAATSKVRFGIEAGRFEIPPSIVADSTLTTAWGRIKE